MNARIMRSRWRDAKNMLSQIVAADSLGCQFSKQYSNVRLWLWTFFKAVAELHVRIRIRKPGEQIDGISFVVETG